MNNLNATPRLVIGDATHQLTAHIVSGSNLAALIASPAIRRPGVYMTTWACADGRTAAYVGTSGDALGSRLGSAAYRLPQPIKYAVLITDDRDHLTRNGAKVLERIAYQALRETGTLLIHPEPHGAKSSFESYAGLRLAWGHVACGLKKAGVAFADTSDRVVAAGPQARAWVPEDEIGDALRLVLETKKESAAVRRLPSGVFILERGSHIAVTESPHINGVGALRRTEHYYSGVLRRDGDQVTVTRPIAFASLSAATRYVCGQSGANTARWRRVADVTDTTARGETEMPDDADLAKRMKGGRHHG